MGSISRMIRAQSTHSPGHITTVGTGTYVDPDIAGGAANEAATKSTLHPKLVTKIEIEGQQQLMYKALPVQIALIRGTTGENYSIILLLLVKATNSTVLQSPQPTQVAIFHANMKASFVTRESLLRQLKTPRVALLLHK